MHAYLTTQADTALDDIVAGLPTVGKLRPATTVCAGLSYARVSKSVQTSIPGQQECIARLAHRLGVPIVRELADTGSGMKRERDGYQALLAEVETQRYSHVFLFKADRLARDSAELQTTVKRLRQLGVKVWDTSVGELTPQNVPVLAMLAEMEIRNLSERTAMGHEQHSREGSKIGGVPTGYVPGARKGHPEPHPTLGPLVTELFEKAAAGTPINALHRWWNEASGQAVETKHIRNMLHNPYYAGLTVNFRVRQSILEGKYARPQSEWHKHQHDQPLIDRDTWLQVQGILAQHSNVGQHRAKASQYALQGLLHCARCERRMYGHYRPGKDRNYRCPVCKMERGTKKTERAVQRCLAQLDLCGDEALEAAQRRVGQLRQEQAARLDSVTQQIERLTTQRMALYARLDRGVIDEEQYSASVAALDAQRSELRREEGELRDALARAPIDAAALRQMAASALDWRNWSREIGAQPIEDQQAVYRLCCQRVLVDPELHCLTVEYTPRIALVLGQHRCTVDL